MFKRIAGLGTAAGLGVLLVSAAAAQATSPTSSATVQHLVFVDHQTQSKYVDTAPKGKPNLGDSFVFTENTTQSGKRVGFAGGQCTIVRMTKSSATTQCAVSVSLPKGQLTIQGLQTFPLSNRPSPPSMFAITGGTGAYRTAGGQIKVTDVSANSSRIDVYLITS